MLSLGASCRENLGHLLLEAMLPMGNLGRMHPVGAGSLIDGFESFERFERHPGFALGAVLFPLCRHLPSPQLHLLLTQHSIFITCPVFGVHYIQQYLGIRHDDHPALFVTQGENPIRLQSHGTWKRFRRYAKRAGIGKRVYPHMLRHTMATTLLANGCPIGHIRALLGHEHLTTTCRYYLGIIAEADVKAAHAKYLSYDVNQGQKTNGKLGTFQIPVDSSQETSGGGRMVFASRI